MLTLHTMRQASDRTFRLPARIQVEGIACNACTVWCHVCAGRTRSQVRVPEFHCEPSHVLRATWIDRFLHGRFLFFPLRASAPAFAIAFRCLAESFAARALPPTLPAFAEMATNASFVRLSALALPPKLPKATACGFFAMNQKSIA